ncbi:hypothetical protein VNO77_17633 [Canavalia gladiata]|uniref:Uncharacterized protein n=1 Tax=Canavalia gladiata TaxID=3824 RepID=A0AAN9LMR0_CANGL
MLLHIGQQVLYASAGKSRFCVANGASFSNRMGFVVVVSLPLILFILILALACYLLGRAKGRRQSSSYPQQYGPPAPPPQAQPK